MERRILTYLQAHQAEILQDLYLLVQAQASTSDIPQLQICRQTLEQIITDRTGIIPAVYKTEGGHDMLRFEYGRSAEQVLLVGHYDTVHPVGSFGFREEGNRLIGPGIYDMKSGLVSAIWTIRAYQQLGITPGKKIVVLFNGDEETGSEESTATICREAGQSAAALVLEPATTEGDLKTGRKGMLRFRITISGREAHSGNAHADGVSALEELAHEILFLHSLTDYNAGVTTNVGIAQGGTKVNVVAGQAVLEAEARFCTALQKEQIINTVCRRKAHLPGIVRTVEVLDNRDPMEQTEKNLQLFEKAHSCAQKLGISFGHQFVGGFSDANPISAMGIPVLDGLGAVGGCAHAPEEYIIKKEYIPRIALLAALITTL